MITISNPSLLESGSEITWLFKVSGNTGDHYFALKPYTFDGNTYQDRIIDGSFKGVKRSVKIDSGLPAPVDVSFAIHNVDQSYSDSEFSKGNAVEVSIVLKSADGLTEEKIWTWKLVLSADAVDNYGKIDFDAKDPLQEKLNLIWSTELVTSLFNCIEEGKTIPHIYGAGAYIPCPVVDIGGNACCILGEKTGSETFNISGGASPIEFDTPVSIDSADIAQNEVTVGTKTYRYALINGGQGWQDGGSLLSPALNYYRSDTQGYGPVDVLAAVLTRFGVSYNSTDLSSAGSVLSTRSPAVVFRGGWWFQQTVGDALKTILIAAAAYLDYDRNGDLTWKFFNKTPAATISTVNRGSYRVSGIKNAAGDSGFLNFSPLVFPGQHRQRKLLVPCRIGGSYTDPITNEVKFHFATGTTESSSIINAKKAATLYFHAKCAAELDVRFDDDITQIRLTPRDVVRMADLYGGIDVVIDSIQYGADGKGLIKIQGTRYSDLFDWDDLSAMTDDQFSDPVVGDMIETVKCGPDGTGQNVLKNRLRLGAGDTNCLVLDPNDVNGNRLWVGNADPANATFALKQDGSLRVGTAGGDRLEWDAAAGTLSLVGTGGDYTEDEIESGISISTGGIEMSGTSSIRANKASLGSTNSGFWFGPDGASIGDATNFIYYNHSTGTLTISGQVSILNPADVRSDLNVDDGADNTLDEINSYPSIVRSYINVGDGADSTQTAIQSSLTISSGGIVMSGGGVIRAGKSSPSDSTSGFYLGYDSGAYQFAIGDSASSLIYNGTGMDLTLANGDALSIYGGDASPARLRFYTSTGTLIASMSATDTNGGVFVYPSSANSRHFGIGETAYSGISAFDTVAIYAYDSASFNARYDSSNFARLVCDASSSGGSLNLYANGSIDSTISMGGGSGAYITITTATLNINTSSFLPTTSGKLFGNSSYRWSIYGTSGNFNGNISCVDISCDDISGDAIAGNSLSADSLTLDEWSLTQSSNLYIRTYSGSTQYVEINNTGSGSCNLWVEGQISGDSLVDRSFMYIGDDAISQLRKIMPRVEPASKNKAGLMHDRFDSKKWAEVDHMTLPAGVLTISKDDMPARDIGAQTQINTSAILQNADRLDNIESRLSQLERAV